jgi:peptidoglycan L-alanyl-D-glutamate endopeptidase CwlK
MRQSSRLITDLHPDLQDSFNRAKALFLGRFPSLPVPFLTQTYRNAQDQQNDYNKGRDNDGNVINPHLVITNAKPGQSPHDYYPALAFDISFLNLDGSCNWDFNNYQNFADCLNFSCIPGLIRWGHVFPAQDNCHYELTEWVTIAKDETA